LIIVQAPYFTSIAFHYGVAQTHLTITANHDLPVAPHREDGCSTILFQS
jgi:hypothetical protein